MVSRGGEGLRGRKDAQGRVVQGEAEGAGGDHDLDHESAGLHRGSGPSSSGAGDRPARWGLPGTQGQTIRKRGMIDAGDHDGRDGAGNGGDGKRVEEKGTVVVCGKQ